MTTGEQALTLLDEANPVPDLDSYGVAALTGTDYLANIEEGMDEMIETEPDTPKDTNKRRRGIWIGAAAAVVVVVLAVAVLPNLGSVDAVDTIAPPLVTMEFEDTLLTAGLDECPLDKLENQQAVEWKLDGTDESGLEWRMNATINVPQAGNFSFEAKSTEGSPHYQAPLGAPLFGTSVGETSASYDTVFFDATGGEGDVTDYFGTVTIECAG